jgi:hypothetical protein
VKNVLLALIPFLATLSGVAQGQILVTDQTYYTLPPDVAMGSLGATVAWYQLTNQSTVEDAKILSLRIFDNTIAAKPSFVNMRASFGPITCIGSLNTEYAGAAAGYEWILNCPAFGIASKASALLMVQADVPDDATGAAQDNSVHRFQITAASSVNAIGAESNQPLTVLAFAYGVPVRVLRSSLYVSVSTDSPTDSTMIFVAGSGGSIILHKLTITFRDEFRMPAFLSPNNIFLLGPGGDVVANGYAIKISSENTITWFFNPGLGIFPGSLVSFQLQMPVPLEASIAQATDLVFADGADPAATTGLNLAAQNFPIKISGPTRI